MTKEITIDGKRYVIRKLTVRDDIDLQSVEPEKAVPFIISRGLVEPKYSLDEAFDLPRDVAFRLFVEIFEYSNPSEEILKRLRNWSSQAQQQQRTL